MASPAAAAPERVVFLDVDGVLHSTAGHELFDASCMERLVAILTEGRAVVCLSSSWRESDFGKEQVNEELSLYGLPAVVDCTPVDGFASRTDEILDWLSRHPTVTHWVAIDDIDLACSHGDGFGSHFVHTRGEVGLTDEDAVAAVKILQRPADQCRLPAAVTAEGTRW